MPADAPFGFQRGDGDALLNSATNVQLLRKLWLDRTLIQGDDLGPGDPGDFDHGAWHSSCHLLGAGGVRRAKDGRLLWLEISHLGTRDEYYASVTGRASSSICTLPLDSAEGRGLLDGSTLLGFVEGTSTGRTSARGVFDAPELFNLWRRQDFDQPIASPLEGGKVWEHWCTTRDIRPTHALGTSVLTAYVSLTAALSDLFAATVARGRRDYGHPAQLCGMVRAGFVREAAAVRDLTPWAIPVALEALLLDAEPVKTLLAAEMLDWSKPPGYFMFARRLSSWSKATEVKKDLKAFASRMRA